jgi:integrative and conjugative element protein (TIGR02256 family)
MGLSIVHALREGAGGMIAFPIAASNQRLVFSSGVLSHFAKHRQLRWWQREAGGQLFARFAMPDVIVEEATGPRRTDLRTRTTYRPNRRAEQREIISRHTRGLHYVGDWHTHPEPVPSPSRDDELSMRELVMRSKHALNGFILVIVGQEIFPAALCVSFVPRSGDAPLMLQPLGVALTARDPTRTRVAQ